MLFYSNIQNCNIVDVSHQISKYNIEEAGFVLAAAYVNFPKDTIHIVSVDATLTKDLRAVCVYYKGQYFISTDNGVLSQVLKGDTDFKAISIRVDPNMRTNDVFIYCAYQLMEGKPLEYIGDPLEELVKLNRVGDYLTVEKGKMILGKVIYEDSFGNLVTNIDRDTFEKVGGGMDFEIVSKGSRVTRLSREYSDFKLQEGTTLKDKVGDFIALFNDLDLLVLTLYYSNLDKNGGSPSRLMNINIDDNVSILFLSSKK